MRFSAAPLDSGNISGNWQLIGRSMSSPDADFTMKTAVARVGLLECRKRPDGRICSLRVSVQNAGVLSLLFRQAIVR